MPLPKWIARVNKRVFNPREIRGGKRPVLTHVGRATGAVYNTPLAVYPVANGYMFVLMYGSESDWVQNVLAAGSAQLQMDGHQVPLTAPRLVPKTDAYDEMGAEVKPPPDFLKVDEFLRMDVRTAA